MMGLESAANALISLFLQVYYAVYNTGEQLLSGLPQNFILAFVFLVSVTFPAALMYIFVAYRKYILYVLMFGWFLYILAVVLF